MSTIVQSPMTWVDVARSLAALAARDAGIPSFLVRARANWYGLVLEVDSDGHDAEVLQWLGQIFPGRLRENPERLELEGPQHYSELPVEIEVVDEVTSFKPSFGIVDGIVEFKKPSEIESMPREVPVVAALSVKGGTGRTTTATAFALRWAALQQKPVLLVDADLEAPGISYLFEGVAGTPKVSLEDVIVLAHAEDSEASPDTIAFAAERLRDHAIPGNLIVLPLRRDLDELASSSLRPEHLSTPERPFALADLLAGIAAKLACCGVVVDVRAGLVPIGVNLALDPNVSPIIVTTLADQSVRATAALVRFLSREIRRSGGSPRKPLLVINRVPAVFKQSGMDKLLIEPLVSDLISALVPDRPGGVGPSQDLWGDVADLEPFQQVEVPELPDIQVSSGEWSTYTEQINGSGFAKLVATGIDQWINSEIATSPNGASADNGASPTPSDVDARGRLARFAEQLIAAENAEGQVPKPLVTQSLAALALRFQSEVPIAVSEGAKGTGKTLAARYFVSQVNWSRAVTELVGKSGAVEAFLLPVCASVQSSGQLQAEVDVARRRIATELGFHEPMTISDTVVWLKDQFAVERTEGEWVNVWLDVIAWSSGFQPKLAGAGIGLLDELRRSGRSVVAVFEGLEELYTSVADAGVERAMRALLISLPQRLRSETRRPVGSLIFARRDTVESAVKQNLDQYRREYASFALTWNESDILELAAWLAAQSGALPAVWDVNFGSLAGTQKTGRLERLWGRKLGPDDVPGKRTREAYTATWIIAVLSDLRGRLVPRDLVRFLATAAAFSPSPEDTGAYPERLLVPRALRDAVEPTSVAKVRETEEEIAELGPIFEKFRQHKDQISAPLDAQALAQTHISDAEVLTLARHGIVFGEAPPFEVPELYRRGLGLRHAGARRSVINLYRKARPGA